MRTDIKGWIRNRYALNGCTPVQFLEFHFPSGIVYATDREFTSNSGIAYEPIVESWGDMTNTSTPEQILLGTALGTKQLTITLFDGGAIPFSSRFNTESPENVFVKLYQWETSMWESRKFLIDTFIIQDPITYNEGSSLLSLDLVSHNQFADPYVGQIDPTSLKFYGITIGNISDAASSEYGTATSQGGTVSVGTFPVVQLDGAISAIDTIIAVKTDPSSVGFPSSGYLIIDYERIYYSGVTTTSFTGCSRGRSGGSGAMPHANSQYVFRWAMEYLYQFGAGPLDNMGPVYVDGEIYGGQHTIYKNRNPVQVGFVHGYPFEKSLASSEVSVIDTDIHVDYHVTAWDAHAGWSTLNGLVCDLNYNNLDVFHLDGAETLEAYTWIGSYAGSQDSGIATNLADYSDFQEAKIYFKVSGSGLETIFRAEGYLDGTEIKVSQQSYLGIGGSEIVTDSVSMNSRGMDGLKNGYQLRCFWFFGTSDYTFAGTLQIGRYDCMWVEYSYVPHIKVYSTTITCDLSSGAGTTNPADVILSILGIMGIAHNADANSFQTAREWFNSNSYEFNGYLDGGLRCREVLSMMQQQSRSRLIFNGGEIKLKIRYPYTGLTSVRLIKPNALQMRSISVTRQPIRETYNSIQIRYDNTAGTSTDYDSFADSIEEKDTESINNFGIQENIFDFSLVESTAMAQDLADLYIAELPVPFSFVTFRAFLENLDLEIGDMVQLSTNFNNLKIVSGDIIGIKRIFGSGKTNQINLFEFTLRSILTDYDLEEFADTFYVNDSITTYLNPTGYGATLKTGGYGV